MLGSLTAPEIDMVLKSQLIGRIGCYAENKILIVPITYVFKDGYIHGHSHEGEKIISMSFAFDGEVDLSSPFS